MPAQREAARAPVVSHRRDSFVISCGPDTKPSDNVVAGITADVQLPFKSFKGTLAAASAAAGRAEEHLLDMNPAARAKRCVTPRTAPTIQFLMRQFTRTAFSE